MKRQIIVIGAIVLVSISLVGCNSSERAKLRGENEPGVRREKQKFVGMPDPSAVYCARLGYKIKVVTDDEGGQYGVCIFPDGSECEAWAFYRGKCGQEWSYCKRNGYDLKDLERHEGWFRGAVCIDRTT
ncbi:hypothetical protein ES703_126062 [subsurface metagenome]